MIDELAEGQEGDLVERGVQEERNVGAGRRNLVDEAELLEVIRGHIQCDSVADGLVEAVVGSALEEEGLAAIGHLVVVVAQFVMHGDEVVGGGLEAGLDAHIALVVDVPCAGMADYIAVAGMREHRPFPKTLRQRIEAQ